MDLGTTTDEQLAEAAASGDEAAFAGLYARYSTPVHDFASRLTRSREDGADVTQVAFERAWRNLSRRRSDKRFKPWLFSITHNTAMEVLRRRRPAISVDDEEAGPFAVLPAGVDVEAEASAADLARDVWAAAEALSPTEYAVLHQQLREEMDADEIADVMGMKVGAVYTALSRAKDSFEEAFAALQLMRRGRRDCADLNRLLAERASATLDRELRRAIRAHVDECEECTRNCARFVAPAELFAALVPIAGPIDLPDLSRAESDNLRPPRRWRRWSGTSAAAGVLLVGVVVIASGGDGDPGEDATAPRDPTTVVSPSHAVGVASDDPTVEVHWSGAGDPAAEGEEATGVAGFSVSWTRDAKGVPPPRQTLPATARSAESPSLEDGEWWFHLRTVDEAGNWTSTVHLGPFVVAAEPCPPAEILVDFWKGRMDFSVDPASAAPGTSFTVRARFTDAEGRATGERLAREGVEFGVTVDGVEVGTAPVHADGLEASVETPAGPPGCTTVAITHGIAIAEIGLLRTPPL